MNKIKSWLCYGLVNWYTCVLCLTYGVTLTYIGGVSISGWRAVAEVGPVSAEAWLLVFVRFVAIVLISFSIPALLYRLTYLTKEEMCKGDIWFGFLNFALIVHVTELAIIDILLHGI